MSASEKLKALGVVANEALYELAGDAEWAHAYQPGGGDAPDRSPDVKVVLAALPQIVAVVLNAELVSKVLGPTPLLDAALAALDEALT